MFIAVIHAILKVVYCYCSIYLFDSAFVMKGIIRVGCIAQLVFCSLLSGTLPDGSC